MTNRFVRSGVTQKTIRFKVQIEDYTKYACKGYYTSPEFGKDDCESKWSLLVHVYDGADHENFIDVRLQRHDYVTEMQFVNVKTSIVNCFGFNVLKNEKKILFGGSSVDRILAVAKEELKGLKKTFYLPKDTLILQCDLLIQERNVSAYNQEERFLNNFSHNENNFSEHFARSRLVKKAEDYFVRKIANFSVQSYGGRITTSEFQSENLGGSWCLVVCNATDYNNSSEYIDIRLMRQESYEYQLVKINLSITDPLHNVLLSKEKFAYFTSSREVQMLSSTETVISSWYGLRKKQLIPDDTLTLHCKMVLYEQIDDTVDRKKDFDSHGGTSGSSLAKVIPYFVAICFVLPVILHCLWFVILPFIWHLILDIFEAIKILAVAVLIIVYIIYYIKQKAEDIENRKKAKEIKRKLREERERRMLERYEYGTHSHAKNYCQNHRKPKNSKPDYNRKWNYSNQKYRSY